jgi:hypothetical protein
MPYIGKKPADIIATAVDTTTGTFSGDVDVDAGITVDNITIDGTEIDLSSGDLTIDVAGDINLDSDSGYVLFKDGGTEHARIFQNNSGDVNIGSQISDKDMKFTGNDGGVAITALTLDMSAGGAATLNNGLTLADGNLVVASGHGIDFSAAGGSAGGSSSALLDDYEEGTWTPTIYGTTTAGTTTYFQQVGTYTKVGRLVTVQIFLNITGQTGAGSVRLGGLPFTAGAGANTFPFFPKVGDLAMSTDYYPIFSVAGNDTFCYMEQAPTGGGTIQAIPLDTSFTCEAVVTYWTA